MDKRYRYRKFKTQKRWSSKIASHFSVDMTKNAGIRCIYFNESDLLTCFSNDYGYENWIKQVLKFYSDKRDLVILISVSGESKNMLITFTGFKNNNSLSKLGNINIWVNSKNYDIIENTHQFWLLLLVDSLDKFKKDL